MSNCFQLTRKSDMAAGPVVLQKIDDEMRAHFGAPADANAWYCGWYDYIGFCLAMGRDWAWLRNEISQWKDSPDYAKQMLAIVDWLEANFTADAWAEIGKR